MFKNRTCKVCGEKYFYCFNHTCDKTQPSYMALFHDENCKTIFDVLNKLYFNQITNKEAVRVLKKCDLSVLEKDSVDLKIKNMVYDLVNTKTQKQTKAEQTDDETLVGNSPAVQVEDISEENPTTALE